MRALDFADWHRRHFQCRKRSILLNGNKFQSKFRLWSCKRSGDGVYSWARVVWRVLNSKFWEGWQFAKGTASASTAALALRVSHPLESPPFASTHSSRAFTVPDLSLKSTAILPMFLLSLLPLHYSVDIYWVFRPSHLPLWCRCPLPSHDVAVRVTA